MVEEALDDSKFLDCCRLRIQWTYEQLMTSDVRLLSMICQNKFTKYVTSVQFPALLNTRFGLVDLLLFFSVVF